MTFLFWFVACGPAAPEAGVRTHLRWEDPAVAASLLARVRDPSAPAVSVEEPTLVLGCRYLRGEPARCALGQGDSGTSAADQLRATLAPEAGSALRLDVVIERSPWTVPLTVPRREVGLVGFHRGEVWLSPLDLLARNLYPGPDPEEPVFDAAGLAKLLGTEADRPQGVEAIWTVTWAERSGAPPQRLLRAHVWPQPEPDVELLEERGAWAADHLTHAVDPVVGSIRYRLHPGTGARPAGYNILRHAGSTWAMLQAVGRHAHRGWLVHADRALARMLRASQRDVRLGPWGGGEGQYLVEAGKIKLGGAGLALVALAEHRRVTMSDRHLEDGRRFATFLVSQQRESGEFIAFAPLLPDGPPVEGTSAYYPGEAILGLLRWNLVDPNPLWVETAHRGAWWLVHQRDAGKSVDQLDVDHWLSYALAELNLVAPHPAWWTYSQRLAEAARWQQARARERVGLYPDYAGGVYDPARCTPTATRAEALVARLDLCRQVVQDCPEDERALDDALRFVLACQYTPDQAIWTQQPDLAKGGFAGGLVDPEIRNDHVQHALSALLGAERLKRPDGAVLGAPGWTRVFPPPREGGGL